MYHLLLSYPVLLPEQEKTPKNRDLLKYLCTLEKEGFLGTFYESKVPTDKAIILVGGSGEKRELVSAKESSAPIITAFTITGGSEAKIGRPFARYFLSA